MKQVKIINYFFGNIYSVTKAFEYYGCKVSLVDRPEGLAGADYVVLPGVGAFGEGMKRLREQELIDPLLTFIKTGKPFLGICLGMQLLFSYSEEFGRHDGLGVIPGAVLRLPDEKSEKIPHIGWNSIELPQGRDHSSWHDTILAGIPERKDMYFVHSFIPCPKEERHWLSRTPYGKSWLCSTARHENVFASQYHPEKSARAGLKIIENFLTL